MGDYVCYWDEIPLSLSCSDAMSLASKSIDTVSIISAQKGPSEIWDRVSQAGWWEFTRTRSRKILFYA